MELRYYLIFAAAFLALQLFLYSFGRTLGWLFRLTPRKRKWVTGLSFIAIDGLFLLTITRTITAFREIALILALLLFAFFLSILTACVMKITSGKASKTLRIAYPFVFAGIIGLSVYNAYTPVVIHQTITLNKPLKQPIRIGVASDLHLGKLFGGKQLDELAEIFNREKVDLILLPGDIMDDNTEVYLAENMRPHLAKLKAPLGVYATLGNHDFFGSQMQIAQEIETAGIQVLWDQEVEIGGQFTIVGRNDATFRERLPTKALLAEVNTELPVFLLDHQPNEIEEHAKLPIDLQVSGHTHKGQIFPANLITRLVYRLDYGYEKIGNGNFVVTSGYGFWGIPMRLGSQSEVWILDVKGTNE
nr:metallophosphoesterase [uncultured Haemophilus sp.]